MKTYNQFITELSAGTLARYIAKATGSLRSAAAKHGRKVALGKPIDYRKYLNKSKTASSPLGSTERMMNRETGIKRAADKLAGKAEEQRLDNIIRSTVDGGSKPAKKTKKIDLSKMKPGDPRSAFFDKKGKTIHGFKK